MFWKEIIEHIVTNFLEFSHWCKILIGIEPHILLGIVSSFSFLWRLCRILVMPKREVLRRQKLTSNLQGFIKSAQDGMGNKIKQLNINRLNAQAKFWTNQIPIEALKSIHGVGRVTIQNLRTSGYRTLGDVYYNGIGSVHGVGNFRMWNGSSKMDKKIRLGDMSCVII